MSQGSSRKWGFLDMGIEAASRVGTQGLGSLPTVWRSVPEGLRKIKQVAPVIGG